MPEDLEKLWKPVEAKLDVIAQAIGVHPGWILMWILAVVLFVYLLNAFTGFFNAWRKPK